MPEKSQKEGGGAPCSGLAPQHSPSRGRERRVSPGDALTGSISQMWARRRNERPFSRDQGLSSQVKNAFHSILTFPLILI